MPWRFFLRTFAGMKRHLLIGLLLLLLALSACHTPTREARCMVKRAYLLADTLPDSTARLIDSVLRMPASFSERERMDMALLQAKALFGDRGEAISPIMDDDFFDDKGNLSTSPELERAAAYYAGKKQYAKAAHAALYSGFVQQHYNEKESAMRSFKEAELYGKHAVDSLTMAQAEYWMGKLLYSEGNLEEALNMFDDSKGNIGNQPLDIATIENGRAATYILLQQFDNANDCFRKSLFYAEKHLSAKVKRKVLNNYAVLYRLQGKYDQAVGCLRQIQQDKDVDANGVFLLNLNLGNVFLDERKMDSAVFYYERMESLLTTTKVKLETQLAAYDALYKFSLIQKEDSLSLLYRKCHEDILYAIMQQRQEQNFYRIQQQYDYESLQNTLNRMIILRHRIILIIGLLLFVTTAIVLILQRRHKQLLEEEAEMKKQIDNLKSDLRESIKTSYLEQELTSRLRLIIYACHTKQEAYDPKKEWNPLVLRVTNGKESVFEAIVSEMEKVYPNLYAVLRQRYPELNETEIKVCLLSFSDLSNTEIAEILNVSKYTVDKNRSKLRDKLNLTSEKMKEQLHKVLAN
jgi:tetratricopeptide (TPR) repeat protein